MSEDFLAYQQKLKDNIKLLVENGKLESAKELLVQYEEVVKNDIDIYSIKGVIAMIEGNMEVAEKVFKEGLEIQTFNFDLLYNLAYLYQSTERNELAIKYYKKALKNAKTKAETEEAERVLKELGVEKIEEEVEVLSKEDKKKIVFFSKGDDKFIWDIINELSKEYETKKITITKNEELKLIDKWMEWADICWFEWCDELVIYGSKLPIAREKKIICKLHSYEAFTNYPNQVNWNTVDKVIFVAEHIKKFVVDNFKLAEEKTIVIPNGLKMNNWKFKLRRPGFKVAYVGYINYKKGPMLLLQTFKAIYEKDKRYKFYVAGQFQDPRDSLYFQQMIKEYGLEKNFFFEGWQDDLDSWLDDKNYIICTSILESQNMSVMQAMAKGIKPIIHNFVGARDIYPNSYLWNTIDEAIEMILSDEYDSEEYRKFIEDNYSLQKHIKSIKKLFKSFDSINYKNKNNIVKFTYSSFVVNFYLPLVNDHIQKVIYMSNNFYEIEMLEDIKNRIGTNKVIVDVGANIGNHTVYFAKICKAKRVYSFEPQELIFEILKKNVQINNLESNVKLYKMGLGKEHCYVNIDVIDKNNYGRTKLDKKNKGKIEVNSLDNLLIYELDRVDIIKIDVEGMEIEVLEGAQKILSKFKPYIYAEASNENEFNRLALFLKQFGYKVTKKFNATPTYLFE